MTATAIAADVTIRIGTTSPDADNPQKRAFTAMSEYIAFRSAGTMEVEVFYGGSLGGDRELLEQVQGGSLQFCVVADGAVANFFPPIQAVAIPYLFTSSAHALEFFNNSDFFNDLADEMRQETGLRIMGAAESGFRNFTNNERPIRSPEDMEGLRMRTMESPVFMALMDSLGAAPTPIAFNELIMSLRQGVVDGQENAVTTVRNFGLWEVQKYMSIDEHVYSPGLMVTNDEFYAGLTPGQRQIFSDGAWVYATVLNAGSLAAYSDDIAFLRENGVEIYVNTAEEKEAFRAAAQPAVVAFIAEQVGQDRVDAMLQAVEETRQRMYAAE
jgi:C4-dicarboxylate-binding protein DctP